MPKIERHWEGSLRQRPHSRHSWSLGIFASGQVLLAGNMCNFYNDGAMSSEVVG